MRYLQLGVSNYPFVAERLKGVHKATSRLRNVVAIFEQRIGGRPLKMEMVVLSRKSRFGHVQRGIRRNSQLRTCWWSLVVIGGLAEFERELIRTRTDEGRKRAKARGVRFGRPRKMTPHQRQEAMQRLAAGETQADVARTYNVDATTIGRLLGDRPFHGGANLVALQ